MRPVILIACLFGASHGMSFKQANDDGPCAGVVLTLNEREFFTAYSRVFHMSDGSSIDIPEGESPVAWSSHGKSLNYMRTMLAALGVRSDNENGALTFRICTAQAMDLLFLSIVGNFVTSPADPDFTPSSSVHGLATVVVDVFTGAIVLVNSFNSIRTYFLEALLIISVLAISRLAIVRKVVTVTKPGQ